MTTFKDFTLRDSTSILPGDYIVGYKSDGTAEFRILTSEFLKSVSGGGVGLKSTGILAQSGIPQIVTGTITETALATIPYPALGINSAIKIEGSLTGSDSTSKTINFRANGNLLISLTTTTQTQDFLFKTANRGAANSQFSSLLMWTSVPSILFQNSATSFNLSAPSSLVISVVNSSTAQTERLEMFTAELINP
jgi:hypothetical protein